MGRIGKIARLPSVIRTMVNQRIEDGEPARPLLEWLNACPSVQHTLKEYFDGKPITEQNLSEWKQRGFAEWQRHQETRELAREFLAEAEELEEEVGDAPLTDRLTETVALTLARLLREVVSDGQKGPEQRAAVIEIAREFSRLRRGDHVMQRLRMEQEDRNEAELEDEVQEFVESYRKIENREMWIESCYSVDREKFEAARKEGRLTPRGGEGKAGGIRQDGGVPCGNPQARAASDPMGVAEKTERDRLQTSAKSKQVRLNPSIPNKTGHPSHEGNLRRILNTANFLTNLPP